MKGIEPSTPFDIPTAPLSLRQTIPQSHGLWEGDHRNTSDFREGSVPGTDCHNNIIIIVIVVVIIIIIIFIIIIIGSSSSSSGSSSCSSNILLLS